MRIFQPTKILLLRPLVQQTVRKCATQSPGAYQRALQNYPLLMQSLQASALMGGGDLIAQFFIEKKRPDQLNLRRTLQFAGMGLFVVSMDFRLT